MTSVLVIGAGISGLLAAQDLQKNGFDVTVIDKGRGLGGRMATRRLEIPSEETAHIGRADHGAQYITADGQRFTELIHEMQRKGVLEVWESPVAVSSQPHAKRQRYIAPDGMTAVAKYCAQGLKVRLGERVVRLEAENQCWRAYTDKDTAILADMLLITAPMPQTLMLLSTLESDILSPMERDSLESITYTPCIALMVALKYGYSANIEAPGIGVTQNSAVMWIADNQQKGISPDVLTLTAHTTDAFAEEHWETREEELVALLLAELRPYFLPKAVAAYSLHRWRYSRVARPYPEPFFAPVHSNAPLILAGDAFAKAALSLTRVEDAAVSAWAAAAYICGLSR